MEPKKNSYKFAKVLETALDKGQNENQLTVKELIKELKDQLEPLFKK
ncbi:hypothetical protein BGM26_06280 [Bacillus sp. FJAT-29790]|nr:hypothetical protein [Bacillus sp. FJAT-29790]MBU8878595.1 hypothetical protein [Bacillus sp. FJAT-29790]